MKEAEFEIIASRIADVLDNVNNTEKQNKIKQEMEALANNFMIYNQPTY